MITRLLPFIILSTLTLTAACTPCDDDGRRTPGPDGVIISADICNGGDDDSTSIGGSETTTPTVGETGGGGLVCDGELSPGSAWGPCNANGGCDGGANFCYLGEFGSVCLPACDSGPSCETDLCSGGTCRADGACVPACSSDSDCPDSMACDLDAPTFGTCVHPG